jgi:hypothetical protein
MKIFEFKNSRFFHQNWKNRFKKKLRVEPQTFGTESLQIEL